jgi:hypothetical protein
MSGPQDKPFDIAKSLVWEEYKRVKANKGAAGVDGCSIEDFEKDLKNNLFKIWNRMSSGTYFPPPVKAVEIAKAGGGTRTLVCLPWPIASHRRWSRSRWRPARSPSFMMIRMGTGRVGRRCKRWSGAGHGVGRRTGFWILMSRSSSTPSITLSWSRRWRRTPTSVGWCCMSNGGLSPRWRYLTAPCKRGIGGLH